MLRKKKMMKDDIPEGVRDVKSKKKYIRVKRLKNPRSVMVSCEEVVPKRKMVKNISAGYRKI